MAYLRIPMETHTVYFARCRCFCDWRDTLAITRVASMTRRLEETTSAAALVGGRRHSTAFILLNDKTMPVCCSPSAARVATRRTQHRKPKAGPQFGNQCPGEHSACSICFGTHFWAQIWGLVWALLAQGLQRLVLMVHLWPPAVTDWPRHPSLQ